ncbi:MAG: S-adenosylmethionine:tRNA ribosyltransferase-isomerase, partial [Lachnospiraceae bacterium]|nr:S-adenosylmethionine:tRNA ribosyltransferase-isomerase [Lachnospiraceae bacterium]
MSESFSVIYGGRGISPSSSRLLTVDKISGALSHGHFTDIKKYIKKGDCLVLNDTRVIPARLYGTKEETGGAIEF